MVITETAKAERLARAIVSDLQLYNEEAISRARGAPSFDAFLAGLQPALDEGRGLFESRVSPELRPLFDRAVRDLLAASWLG